MRFLTTIFFLLACSNNSLSQNFEKIADSIRKVYAIPELNYAILKSDKIIEIKALGVKKINSELPASLNDRFRIGSNTKTITSYIAAVLVQKNSIQWNTKFFDLFPELKESSNPAYHEFTLQDFITLRANCIKWTYTNEEPLQNEIQGDAKQQRYEFVKWVLKQEPIIEQKSYYFSNPSYVMAALMIEKVTNKDFNQLVKELGEELNIDFQFGQPNFTDSLQTWGHNQNSIPEKPSNNYKLNWLNAAGNINVTLLDYTKFIQLQLNGLLGNSSQINKDDFNKLHYGLSDFSFGWRWFIDENTGLKYSFHRGNPGTFLSDVYIFKDLDLAFIFFMNIQSDEAEKGLDILFEEIIKIYSKK
jgi:CubicO group peptidase (beta-lactamase class C family)